MKRLACLMAVSLFACSSQDDPGSPIPGHDGGTAGTGSKPGLIIVQNHKGSVVASAIFSSTAPAGCKVSTFGPCKVETCPDPGDSTPPLAGAGTLTVTDGTTPLTMTPDTDNSYGVDHTTGNYAVGATVSVSASGKDVPAFSGKSAVMPAALSSDLDLSAVNATQDIALTWTGGGPAGKVVFFAESDDAKTLGQITCTYDAAGGSGTVPSAAVAAVPACSGDSCLWTLVPESDVSFTVGDYQVDLSVRAEGAGGPFGQL